MAARIVAVVVGIWLMIAPAALGYGDPAAGNDRTFGPVAGGFAFVALWEVARPLRWATLPVGSWLVLVPFVLGYGDTVVALNSVACGATLAVTAPLGGKTKHRFGGGWSSLVRRDIREQQTGVER